MQKINEIDQYCSELISNLIKIQLADRSANVLEIGKDYRKQLSCLINTMEFQLNKLQSIRNDYESYIDQLESGIQAEEYVRSLPDQKDMFIELNENGMLSYKGKIHVRKPPESVKLVQQQEKKYCIQEVGYTMRSLNIVNDFSQMKPMFYHYIPKSKSTFTEGIYACLLPGIIIKVPFPEIIDSTKENNRAKSIKCKYNTSQECSIQRTKVAKIYNSPVRQCNFAHDGERLVKIGYPSRCNIQPNFGNPKTLLSDSQNINTDDIRSILLYGINDLIVSAIYYDMRIRNKAEKIVIQNLDLA